MTDHGDMADQFAALRADNARLRRLLDEAGMPDSLRHGVRNTMAMLRTIVRRSADRRRGRALRRTPRQPPEHPDAGAGHHGRVR